MANISDLRQIIQDSVYKKNEADERIEYYTTIKNEAIQSIMLAREELESLKAEINSAEYQADAEL